MSRYIHIYGANIALSFVLLVLLRRRLRIICDWFMCWVYQYVPLGLIMSRYIRIPGANIAASILSQITVRKKKRKPRGSTTLCTVERAATTRVVANADRVPKGVQTLVYVLQLTGGYIYVGQSRNVPRRIQQHMNGKGAVFTRKHKPTGVTLPRSVIFQQPDRCHIQLVSLTHNMF
jgi:hypothetical protein